MASYTEATSASLVQESWPLSPSLGPSQGHAFEGLATQAVLLRWNTCVSLLKRVYVHLLCTPWFTQQQRLMVAHDGSCSLRPRNFLLLMLLCARRCFACQNLLLLACGSHHKLLQHWHDAVIVLHKILERQVSVSHPSVPAEQSLRRSLRRRPVR